MLTSVAVHPPFCLNSSTPILSLSWFFSILKLNLGSNEADVLLFIRHFVWSWIWVNFWASWNCISAQMKLIYWFVAIHWPFCLNSLTPILSWSSFCNISKLNFGSNEIDFSSKIWLNDRNLISWINKSHFSGILVKFSWTIGQISGISISFCFPFRSIFDTFLVQVWFQFLDLTNQIAESVNNNENDRFRVPNQK